MRNLFNTLVVNVARIVPRLAFSPNAKITQRLESKQMTVSRDTVTLSLKKRKVHARTEGRKEGKDHPYSVEVIATIKVLDGSVESPTTLHAHLHYLRNSNGFSSLSPMISIGQTLPNYSPLFHIVLSGDVEQLKLLLSRREYTLQDKSEQGTPLLHVRRNEHSPNKSN